MLRDKRKKKTTCTFPITQGILRECEKKGKKISHIHKKYRSAQIIAEVPLVEVFPKWYGNFRRDIFFPLSITTGYAESFEVGGKENLHFLLQQNTGRAWTSLDLNLKWQEIWTSHMRACIYLADLNLRRQLGTQDSW